MAGGPSILTMNGGSSSIRFALFSGSDGQLRLLAGKVDRIGLPGTTLHVTTGPEGVRGLVRWPSMEAAKVVPSLMDWLQLQPAFQGVQLVAHRVVQAGTKAKPARVTEKLLAEFRRMAPQAPEHLPREIHLIEEVQRRFPKLPQVVCFDSAFHAQMPSVARLLPIPRRYLVKGLGRYGFHGLSYAYLLQALRRMDPEAAQGRLILAHLGNGASMAAVRQGKSVDTSMGFSPAGGLMMGSRSGDLDPGLFGYLHRAEGMTPEQWDQMVNHEAGLVGVSGRSSDMRDLLSREAKDRPAREAVALFCYQAKKAVGALAAVLGGLETLIFTGGIGEGSPEVRARICEGLEFLGIRLDPTRNDAGAEVISSPQSVVTVRVMASDEEMMLAKLARPLWRKSSTRRVTPPTPQLPSVNSPSRRKSNPGGPTRTARAKS